MDLRPLDGTTSAAPQLDPEDMAVLAADGVTTILCNRPDAEVPPSHQADAMRVAAEAAGLIFAHIPVSMPQLTLEAVAAQRDALAGAQGKVVAYCASGTRSAVLWALAMAGTRPADDILTACRDAGYALDGLRPQIEQLEQQA
ncbi:TIGR01244 family sulfur transferase [Jannaschia sp.]|nr:TIGR01244 family sulfur transferase [Jannaschia sp.]